MNSWAQDIGYAVRLVRRRAGLSAAAILTLAIGIAANAAVFGFANTFVLRPLEFPESDRLVHLWQLDRATGDRLRAALPNAIDWKARTRTIEDLALFNYSSETIVGPAGPVLVPIGRMSANVMGVLGVSPILGRGFQTGDDRPGSGDVVVLSHGMWMADFGGRADVLGQTITLDQRPRTIVGVMGPDFQFPLNITRLWIPYELDPTRYGRATRTFQVVARLRSEVSLDQAQAELDGIARELERAWPDANRNIGIHVEPLKRALNFASDVLAPMAALLGVGTVMVLGLACANVAGLLLAAASARQREMAIRTALGASRRRLFRQLIVEAFLLAIPGGALGLLLAWPSMRAIDLAIPPDIYRVGSVGIDAAMLGLTLMLALGAAVLASLVPALRLSGAAATTIRDATPGERSGRTRWFQSSLVVAQVALALMLVAGATLTFRSIAALGDVNPGFDTAGVLSAQIVLPRNQYSEPSRVASFHEALIEFLDRSPLVQSAATVNFLPLNHETDYTNFRVAGSDPGSRSPRAVTTYVSDRYFETIGLPLLRGRSFETADGHASARRVVINQSMAERFWAGDDALGRDVLLETAPGTFQPATVVGIVGDAAQDSLGAPAAWQLYLSRRQETIRYFRVLARGASADELAPSVRAAVAAVDPTVAVTEVRPLAAVVNEYLLPQRAIAAVLATLAIVALLLASVGLHGLIGFFVAQHTRDIGIRVALGAGRHHITRLVAARSGLPVGLGVALGLGAVLAGGSLLESFLYGVRPADPLTLAVLALIFLGVAAVSAVRPLQRALRIDPVISLRAE